MAYTKILNAVLAEKAPENAGPISNSVKISGSSTCDPKYVSLVPGYGVIVVFMTKENLTKVKVNNNVVVVTEGSPGEEFVLVVLDQQDAENWTVMLRSDKDDPTDGATFTAGTGGGPGAK